MKISTLQAANVARVPQFRDRHGRLSHPTVSGQPDGFDWMLSQWSNATCGELGEAANLIKKIERGDYTLDEKREELGEELADVLCYLVLLAHRAGVDLESATIAKFDRVSRRVRSSVFLGGETNVTECPNPDCKRPDVWAVNDSRCEYICKGCGIGWDA